MLAVTAAASLALGPVHARFADSAGFSGAGGATCTACHTTPNPLVAPALARLEGLPVAWEPGRSYALRVSVEGGPPVLGSGRPQGGFDLAVSAGTVHPGFAMGGLVRNPSPQEATYLPAGTLMRSWNLTWTAPALDGPESPAPVQVWLAVLAADGNHVVAANVSDGGERFDSADAVQAQVPPQAHLAAAWRALALAMPQAAVVEGGTVKGFHADPAARALQWRTDGGLVQARATGTYWSIQPPPGWNEFEVRSEGGGRVSPWLTLSAPASASGQAYPTPRASPAPTLMPVLAGVAAATFALWRPRP